MQFHSFPSGFFEIPERDRLLVLVTKAFSEDWSHKLGLHWENKWVLYALTSRVTPQYVK